MARRPDMFMKIQAVSHDLWGPFGFVQFFNLLKLGELTIVAPPRDVPAKRC